MKLVTNLFKTSIAVRSIEQLTSNTGNYYMCGAYSNTASGEYNAEVNTIKDNVYDFDRNVVFGKKISSSDVVMVAHTIPWVEGNTYDMYDDTVENLHENSFYVVVDDIANSKSFFKCLFNGRVHTANTYVVSPVSDKPTISKINPNDEYYRTADGYIWKYITTVSEEDVLKFASSSFTPVRLNSAVASYAVNGAIDVILIEDTGANYSSYAIGNIKLADYGGDNTKLSIESDESIALFTTIATSTSGSFITGSSANVTITTAEGSTSYNVTLNSIEGNIVRYTASLDTQLPSSILSATMSQDGNSATLSTNIQKDTVSSLSAANGFYIGSAIYIRNGTGAGQLRNITGYDIIGSSRVITIDSAFDITLDTTSQFEISPAVMIKGDGTGAKAISHINSSTNGVRHIEIVNRGSNYTYADVTLVGASGMVDLAASQVISPTPAVLRAIIPPKGGHGVNAYTDLFTHTLCISSTFTRDEVPYTNGYSKVGVLGNPVFTTAAPAVFDDRISVTAVVTQGPFILGETIVQENTGVSALIHEGTTSGTIKISNLRGTLADLTNVFVGETSGAVATFSSPVYSTRVKNSGQLLYVEDVGSPINRNSIQSETIKVVIEFF